MQLQLQTHWQVVRHHPVSQVPSIKVMVTRREQDFAGAPIKTVLDQFDTDQS